MESKKKWLILTIVGVMVLAVGALLIWFFNRKIDVIFYNLDKVETVKVKYNSQIPNSKISTKETLGDNFIGWYEISYDKNNSKVIAKKQFNFDSKIKHKTELKAVYKDVITVSFDSDGGTKVNSIIIKKGELLTLPENPTKEGYNFVRWEDEKTTPIYNDALIENDVTLKAIWEKVNEETKVVYTCPNGYSLNGTRCTRTITKDAILLSETCESNYGKSSSLGKCIANKYSSTATPTCPSGYTRRPGYPYCYEKVQSGLDSYTCEKHYADQNGKYTNGSCYYGKSAELTYICPSGYHMSIIHGYAGSADDAHKCYELKEIIKNYSCESGFTLSGTNCIKTETINATKK